MKIGLNKLIIMILLAMLAIPIVTKADIIDINPTVVKLKYTNSQGGAESWAQYTAPFTEENWSSQGWGTFYRIFNWNTPPLMQELYIYGDGWPGKSEEGNIIEFQTMTRWYNTATETKWLYLENGRWYSTAIETGQTYQGCMQTGADYRNIDGNRILVQDWKCVTNRNLDYFTLITQSEMLATATGTVWVALSKNFTFRPPANDEEIQEILNSRGRLHDVIEHMVEDIEDYEEDWYPGISNVWSTNANDLEESLWANMEEENWARVNNITIPEGASGYIWDTATAVLNSNAYVWSLFMSALGVCLIRLVIG